jgi:predicted nucleic acid-binding protein
MKLRVYVETSVISYLTSRPALDVITAGHQATTYKWWEDERSKYELFISQFVIDEALGGDPVAAHRRIASLEGLARLNIEHSEIPSLARTLISERALPQKAFVDALHIAVAAFYGVDILLTWNFKHIANGAMMRHIERVCSESGCPCPKLLTPLQLLGDENVD